MKMTRALLTILAAAALGVMLGMFTLSVIPLSTRAQGPGAPSPASLYFGDNANNTLSSSVASLPGLYNGAGWDRSRSVQSLPAGGNFSSASMGVGQVALSALTAQINTAFSLTGSGNTGFSTVIGKTYDVYTIETGVTGSPATCTLQPQTSPDGATWVNTGTATSITPATGNALAITTAVVVGQEIRFTYSCGTYPTGGTASIWIVFHSA